MNDIKVHVVKYPDRDNLVMRYVDQLTGKPIGRSTGTTKRKEAEKLAAKWEAELQEGRYQKQSKMSWQEFCDKFEADGTGNLKPNTVDAYFTTLNTFGRLCRPKSVKDLTTAKVTTFARKLRKVRTVTVGTRKKRQKTIKLSAARVGCHLRQLKAIVRWAYRQGIIPAIPTFEMPKKKSGAKRMKGRPITGEEFERMLAAAPRVVGDTAAESWKLLLRGLWWSGLRLGEAIALRWDAHPDGVRVILDGQESVLAFDADAQKSGKVELSPLAPEAVELLEPLQEQAGYVFAPQCRDGSAMARDIHKVSKIISRIGKAAGVVVDHVKGKCASAHDLRRAFGYRWSRRVETLELANLMRHASIETTRTYYLGQNAKASSRRLWEVSGNNLGNNEVSEAPEATAKRDVSSYNT